MNIIPDSVASPNTHRSPAILFLHGLGGGPHELAPLIDTLEARGLPVAAPTLPGHEVTTKIMPASNWRDWYASAETAFDRLTSHGRPIVVVAFSTGATLALLLATRRPVARQVLLAPFLAIRHSDRIPLKSATVLHYLAKVLPDLPRRPPPVRDPAIRRQLSTVRRFDTFSVNATLSALDLIEVVKRQVPFITIPTLIIQGQHDSVVEPRAVTWLHRHLGSDQKSLITLPRSNHLVALDHDRDQVISLTTAFVLDGQQPLCSENPCWIQ